MAKKIVVGISTLVACIALIAVLLAAGLTWVFQPVSSIPQPATQFVVPRGQALTIIAKRLASEGFVKQPQVFRFYVQFADLEGRLQAGSYKLSPSMSLSEIALAMTRGTDDIWITIPEGWRREEIAEALERQGLAAFDKTEFLQLTVDREGQLFPDTYLVSRDATTQSLVNLFENTFQQKVIDGLESEVKSAPYSLDRALIVASLLEREATGYEEMRHVAGIIQNRIKSGMTLDIDATLQYVKGYDEATKKWWPDVYTADKDSTSLYNTYRRAGLPPAPIANPGLEAIKAALNPASVSDYFYIHDKTGQIHYAQTLDQHNRNVQQYLR